MESEGQSDGSEEDRGEGKYQGNEVTRYILRQESLKYRHWRKLK
jgi:hypothetical protein